MLQRGEAIKSSSSFSAKRCASSQKTIDSRRQAECSRSAFRHLLSKIDFSQWVKFESNGDLSCEFEATAWSKGCAENFCSLDVRANRSCSLSLVSWRPTSVVDKRGALRRLRRGQATRDVCCSSSGALFKLRVKSSSRFIRFDCSGPNFSLFVICLTVAAFVAYASQRIGRAVKMVMKMQLSDSHGEEWYQRSAPSIAKSSALSPSLPGGLRPALCPIRGLPGISRPSYIRSDTSSISRAPPCNSMPGVSPEKGAPREPPRMGEGGNWQCHVCLNVNYPRRTACNRCLAERNKENTQKVAEFIRLKEGFLQMGLDQQTASAAAAAQQAAHSCANNSGSFGVFGEAGDRLHAGNHHSKTGSSGNVLAHEGEGLRLLSYPLEQPPQQKPILQRPASLDQKVLHRLLQQTETSFLPPVEQNRQQFQQPSKEPSVAGGGLSSRETSGGLLKSSRDTSNEAASSNIFEEDPAACPASSLSQEAMQAGGVASSSVKGSRSSEDVNFIMLRAGVLLGKLLQELDSKGDPQQEQATATALANPPPAAAAKADDVLRAALGMLAGTTGIPAGDRQPKVYPYGALEALQAMQQQYRPSQLGYPQMLAHPDEFRNPSSFLKIYGDPLCSLSPSSAAALVGAGNGNSPAANRDGNWVCRFCNNINFPRRFRCNKCNELRGPEGDKIVAEYARVVYAHHTERLRMQQLQQQLHFLKQQDIQQMQQQLEHAQGQQPNQPFHHRQRFRTAPPSAPSSPTRATASCAPKPFGHAVAAAAAAAAASVAAARPTGSALLTRKPGTSALPVTAAAAAAGGAADAADALASAPLQQGHVGKQQQLEKQQLPEQQQQTEQQEDGDGKRHASEGAALVPVDSNDK
ncbi:hypothetical protein Efla_000345 [Eimeria flavescens]